LSGPGAKTFSPFFSILALDLGSLGAKNPRDNHAVCPGDFLPACPKQLTVGFSSLMQAQFFLKVRLAPFACEPKNNTWKPDYSFPRSAAMIIFIYFNAPSYLSGSNRFDILLGHG